MGSMRLRSSRRTRSHEREIEVTDDLTENDRYSTQSASSRYFDEQFSDLDTSESEDSDIVNIPEFNVNELIDLANELVENNSGTNLSRIEGAVRVRFPLVTSVNEARDIILSHERTGGIYNNDNDGINPILDTTQGDTPNMHDVLEETVPTSNTHRQPMWLELAGIGTVTMFLFAVYRLVTTLVSISAYSENVFTDVFEFVNYINEKGYHGSNNVTMNNTLIYKFSNIFKDELPFLPDTLWMMITLSSFSIYTLFTSGIVLISMLFSAMCLSVCCIVRWKHLGDFIIRVYETL